MERKADTIDGLVKSDFIAQLFGVKVRRVQQLTQEGIIETVEVKQNKRTVRRYDLKETVKKYIAYLSDKAHGRTGKDEKFQELKEEKLKADIALREVQTELHSLKLQIGNGDYISVDEVKSDYERLFTVIKKFTLSLPSRMGSVLSGQIEPTELRRIEKEMSREAADILRTFVLSAVPEDK